MVASNLAVLRQLLPWLHMALRPNLLCGFGLDLSMLGQATNGNVERA